MSKVSVIIPAKNEHESIVKLLRGISLNMQGIEHEVLVVDDSDDNRTAVLALANEAKVRDGRGLGLAQAVLDGIDASDGEYIMVMDADGQHDPDILPEFVKQFKIHDLVIATKHTKEAMAELSWWRKLQSNLGVWLSQVIIPAPVSDPMTGYFGIRRKCLDGIPRGDYYKIDEEKASKMEIGKPENWLNMSKLEQGKWYYEHGVADKAIGIEAIGFKIGLELFAKARWVSHAEIPMYFKRREAGESKGAEHSLHKHLWRLFQNSLSYEVELPKGSEEYLAFYEGTGWQKKWKQDIAVLLHKITSEYKSQRVLDVGCGSSPNVNYMVGERVGIDINEKALEYMREHSDATFTKGSILNIPFLQQSFDTVACIEVLEHLYTQDIEKAMSEIVRVLQPNGYAVLSTPNYSSILWNVVENTQKIFQRRAWTSDHHTKFNQQSLDELCRKHGLTKIRYDSVMNNMDMVVTYQKLN
jgi:ubiquinone/menaquinone biosynthesis C-methylase UbiE